MQEFYRQHDQQQLFGDESTGDAARWIGVTAAFIACGGLGLWFGAGSIALNGFIILFGLYHLVLLMRRQRQLHRHRRRSAEILQQCVGASAEDILDRKEHDDPIALKVLQGVSLKVVRGKAPTADTILDWMEGSLERELVGAVVASRGLPVMGLAGSCAGIMKTLAAIAGGAKDVTNLEAVSEAMAAAFPAMAIAISTTLAAALVGSLLLMGLVELAKARIQAFRDELGTQIDMFPFFSEQREDSEDA